MTLLKTDEVVSRMLSSQMAPWLGSVIRRSHSEEVYHALAMSVRSVFLYRIRDGSVEILSKPGFTIREDFADSGAPEPAGMFVFKEEFIRAQMYRDFFVRVASDASLSLDMLIAVDVNDAPVQTADAPVLD